MCGVRHYSAWMGTRLAPVSALLLIACGPPPAPPVSGAGHGAQGTSNDAPLKSVSPYAAVAFLEAEIALEAGDAKAAIQSLTMALASEPDEPLIKVRLGQAYAANGQAARAKKLIGEVLAGDPGFDEGLVAMGDIAAAEGKPDEAVAYYGRAIEAEPESLMAYERLIGLHRHAGDPGAALEVTRALIAADPLNADALLTASELCLELDLMDEAFAYMSRHVETKPVEPGTSDRYGSLLALAHKLLALGRIPKARFLYATYLGMFPADVEATAGLVRTLVASGDSIAARDLVTSIESPAADAPPWRKLLKADLYLEAGAPELALEELEAGFELLLPTHPPAVKVTWLAALVDLLRFEEARDSLALFEAQESGARADAEADLAAALILARHHEEGWDIITSGSPGLEAHLASRALRQALVALLASRPEPAFAGKVRQALMASTPGRLVLAQADFWSSKSPDPLALMDALEEIRNEDPADDVLVDGWALEAVCVIEGLCKDKPTRVLSLTTKIADLEPDDPRLPGLRGMFYLMTGNRERALLSLEKANRDAALDPLVKVWLAHLVSEQDATRARALLESALLLDPPAYALGRVLEALTE